MYMHRIISVKEERDHNIVFCIHIMMIYTSIDYNRELHIPSIRTGTAKKRT
jgi:hypothetical protein